jgi:hypothetical protein
MQDLKEPLDLQNVSAFLLSSSCVMAVKMLLPCLVTFFFLAYSLPRHVWYSVECDAEGTVTMLECSHFDSRRAEPAFASTPHAAIPPSKRSVILVQAYVLCV